MLLPGTTVAEYPFERQVSLPLEYKGVRVECGYRIDVIVNNEVVVEIKAVDAMHSVFEAQLLTYLKLTGKRVGLLINFHVSVLKDGIIRRVL
jgi:GxxExxY protein